MREINLEAGNGTVWRGTGDFYLLNFLPFTAILEPFGAFENKRLIGSEDSEIFFVSLETKIVFVAVWITFRSLR